MVSIIVRDNERVNPGDVSLSQKLCRRVGSGRAAINNDGSQTIVTLDRRWPQRNDVAATLTDIDYVNNGRGGHLSETVPAMFCCVVNQGIVFESCRFGG